MERAGVWLKHLLPWPCGHLGMSCWFSYVPLAGKGEGDSTSSLAPQGGLAYALPTRTAPLTEHQVNHSAVRHS